MKKVLGYLLGLKDGHGFWNDKIKELKGNFGFFDFRVIIVSKVR